VGSTALAEELMLLGTRYASGVVVTQVVPAVDSYVTAIIKYKSALTKCFPGDTPDCVSLAGFVAARVLMEALRRAGPQLDTEKLADALEGLRNLDLGLGTPVNYGRTEHQAVHKVWARNSMGAVTIRPSSCNKGSCLREYRVRLVGDAPEFPKVRAMMDVAKVTRSGRDSGTPRYRRAKMIHLEFEVTSKRHVLMHHRPERFENSRRLGPRRTAMSSSDRRGDEAQRVGRRGGHL
jgi:hypothetical protein